MVGLTPPAEFAAKRNSGGGIQGPNPIVSE